MATHKSRETELDGLAHVGGQILFYSGEYEFLLTDFGEVEINQIIDEVLVDLDKEIVVSRQQISAEQEEALDNAIIDDYIEMAENQALNAALERELEERD